MKKVVKKNINKNEIINVTISTEGKYFTITGDILKNGKISMCGCIHEEINKYFPEYKPFIDLHLSNFDGIPMYAVENGFYYYQIMNGDAKYHKIEENDEEKWKKILKEHLRINEEEFKKFETIPGIYLHTKETFTEYVDSQKPRWKKEANKAIKMLENL